MVIVSESNSLDHLYLKDYIFEKGISRKKKILIGLKTDSAILIFLKNKVLKRVLCWTYWALCVIYCMLETVLEKNVEKKESTKGKLFI